MKIWSVLGVAAGALCLAASEARAGTIGITSESGISADATIDWSALGTTRTAVSNPFTIASSSSSLNATVSQGTGLTFERRDQGNGWNGNFSAGEDVLWSAGNNGSWIILFSAAVQGFGAQIQHANFGTFSATITVYDAADNTLGTFTRTDGNSNGHADDSAIFIGILSDTADIRKIRLTASLDRNPTEQNFAIGDPRIQLVPLPPSALMGLTLLGGLGLANVLRKRRRTAPA